MTVQVGERSRLRELDGCLWLLEEAHEHADLHVSADLAEKLQRHVDYVKQGMRIADAIERVLNEQGRCMGLMEQASKDCVMDASSAPTSISPVEPPAVSVVPTASIVALEPLDPGGARELTERIRSLVGDVCLLLYEARERCAPAALGYDTWERYVRKEFGMSRRRSYELLDQAHVILTLRSVAGECGIPHITPFLAGYVKEHLNEVVESIQAQLMAASVDEAPTILQHVIQTEHKRFAEERRAKRLAALPTPQTEASSTSVRSVTAIADVNVAATLKAIRILAAQPPISATPEVVAPFQATADRINSAIKWLIRLARVLGQSRDINDNKADARIVTDHPSEAAS